MDVPNGYHSSWQGQTGTSDLRLQISNKVFSYAIGMILLLSIGCDRSPVDMDGSWQQVEVQTIEKPSEGCVVGEMPADRLLRVFLTTESKVSIKGKPLGYGFGHATFVVRDAETGEQLSLTGMPTGQRCVISRSAGRWFIKVDGVVSMFPGGLQTGGLVLEFEPFQGDTGAETVCSIRSVSAGKGEDWREYRGAIRLVAQGAGRFAVVNDVDIEDYLQGVVGSEVYSHWPASVLEAQSIAARSYALYYKQCRNNNSNWDIGSDQGSQVYGGVSKEHIRVSQAVRRTTGVVLTYGSVSERKLFPAYYSAVCGGHTQDAAVVFGDSIEPLRGCECGYCRTAAPKGRYRWADVSIAKSVVSERLLKNYQHLSELGEIISVSVARRSDYGRVTHISLRGSNGRGYKLKAEKFRLAVNSGENQLLSSWYDIVDRGDSWHFENGRGWGHGVGLCQWGSYQMGLEGKSCLEILKHYYRQAMLVRAY